MSGSRKQNDWDELTKIGIRCMISQLIPYGETKEEHLQICQTYMEAAWRHLHRMRFDMEKMHELCEAAEACLRSSTVAGWSSCCTLESRVVVALAEMYDEIRARKLWDGVPEPMLGLPLYFIGWEKARELYEMIAPFLKCFQVKLSEQDIRGAYAEYVAANLYALGFCGTTNFAEVVPSILRHCEEVYRTPSEVLDVFWCQAPKFEILEGLIATYGVGNFRKMSNLAINYAILYGSCDRQIFTQVLTLLAS